MVYETTTRLSMFNADEAESSRKWRSNPKRSRATLPAQN